MKSLFLFNVGFGARIGAGIGFRVGVKFRVLNNHTKFL